MPACTDLLIWTLYVAKTPLGCCEFALQLVSVVQKNPQQIKWRMSWRSIDWFAQSMSVTKRCHLLTSPPPQRAPDYGSVTSFCDHPSRPVHRSIVPLRCFDALSNFDNEHAAWNSIIVLLLSKCRRPCADACK